jgi:TolB-like protein
LQKHFRHFLGRSPVAVLRDLRLDLVRHALLERGGDETIAVLATRCGFDHLGRLSTWYRERFGESPSATRARGREPGGVMLLPASLDRPVIAVLPFRLAVSDPRRAAGLGEELAATLCRLHAATVGLPRAARYHIRGAAREDGAGKLRVTVALFDTASGRYLWADAWSSEADDDPAFVERAARAVSAKLRGPLRAAEMERAWRREPARLVAWELTMRALSCAVRLEPTAQTEALELAQQAFERAPRDPLPLAIAAWCHGMRAGHCFTERPDAEREAARDAAARATALRARDATVEALLASAYTLVHELDRAAFHVNRALEVDGGCAWAWQRKGWLDVYAGRAAEGIECFHVAQRLDPEDPLGFLGAIGIAAASFERADYVSAASWFERGIDASPSAVWANRFLAPSYALSGRKEAARASLDALDAAHPGWTIGRVRRALPHTEGFCDRAAEALESLGMPL